MPRIIYPQTNPNETEQLIISRGQGAYVYDDKGKQYIEGLAGLWSTSLGYGNEELIEVANQQMREIAYTPMFAGKSHIIGIELAETLSDMLPMDDARIFFGNSGSDTNDTHLKLLRYYFNVIGKPEKKKVISRHRAYHGVTMAASCLTGLPAFHQHFNLPIDELNILHIDCPHYYRNGLPDESEAQFCQSCL
ncbi:aminotransferase class III-fold pyridoxal phosphate-dependent enzyme [Thalassotalea sp. Y01]|uniref:aminotransferase class III-fold pyridoxal phosphate-dependent enzyme n=1 Tax=Thalassotalea sp. Y01 TaxID=2729613 RepID=UPI0020070B3A|nr:aminotransferase class III-fold pyridoxal phosphate-dependent enzyme [Thalassotalea sp. Y01]